MANILSLLMFFRDTNNSQGWSESFVVGGTDLTTGLVTITTLANERINFLSQNMQIFGFRAAQIGVTPRQSRVINLTTPLVGAAPSDTNEAKDCVNYVMKTQGNRRRTLIIRGLSDQAIEKDGLAPGFGPILTAAIDSYCQKIIAANLGVKYTQTANVRYPVGVITNTALRQNVLTVTTTGVNAIQDGSVITLRGIRGFPYLLGRWKVKVQDSQNFDLVGSERYNASIIGQGTVQQVTYDVDVFNSFTFDGVSTRATGRPFNQQRGRRSPKVLHH